LNRSDKPQWRAVLNSRRPPPTDRSSVSIGPASPILPDPRRRAGHGRHGWAEPLPHQVPDRTEASSRTLPPARGRADERESRSVRPRNRWSPPALTTRTDGPDGGGRERCADDDDGRAAGCGSRIQGDSRVDRPPRSAVVEAAQGGHSS
ncbi:hypothetical protein THAOC_13497, partial [Thalassiosira oceanica]